MKRLINLEQRDMIKFIMSNTKIRNLHLINTIMSCITLLILIKYICISDILNQYSNTTQIIITLAIFGEVILFNSILWILTVSIFKKERHLQNVINGYYEE